jgi:NitT/TauT family transport system permease protein
MVEPSRRSSKGLRGRRGSRRMSRAKLLALQVLVGIGMLVIWHVLTVYPIIGAPKQVQFFFSTPLDVIARVIKEFSGTDIWRHLGITLTETVLAFTTGAAGGILFGFVFARRELLAAVFDPYIKAANALPRVVLAPIFALWFGLGIWSKVALGFTLVFFIVFFNVYQGVREVSPTVLANARMLGMNERQLLRHVYWPAALTWVFSSLHTSVGFALVGAVVGEYLGSSAGLGYKIQEAESVFDVTGVFAGMVILAVFVIIIDTVVTMIENRLLVWRPPTSTTTT